MKWFRSRTSLRIGAAGAALIVLAAVGLRAELAPYVQNLEAGGRLEAVFFKLVTLGGASIPARRPPAETRSELTRLLGGTPNDAELYWLRASEAERQLDSGAAESDWQKYAQLASDKFNGQIALADYYHRRLEPQKELSALHAAASLPAAPADRFQPAQEQRSWTAFERAVTLIDEQLLGAEAARAEFRAWVERYPKEPAAYSRFLDYAVLHKQYADAEEALKQYVAAFPNDPVFPVRAQAQIEAARGSTQAALAIYDKNFSATWPPELIKSYFELLNRSRSLRGYIETARQAAAANPDDINAAARVFYYWQQQGNLENAQRPLIAMEARKTAQKSPWTSAQLYTLAQLYQAANNPDRAARAYYALYSLPGVPTQDAERALAGIANLLLASAGQNIRFASGDASYYRDIAQADPYPGYLNGVLSLLFNTAEPAYRYSSQNEAAQPYFHRARAAELIALFDSRFPNSSARAGLHARLIQAYAAHGGNTAVIQAGREYLTRFPDSPHYTEVASAMADAYARTSQPAAEFALYDEVLQRLARASDGRPLGERAGVPPRAAPRPGVPQTPEQQAEAEQERREQQQARPRSPEYARILDRYIARLVTLKRVPDAIALYRREIGRNPDDPGLYERLAAFLEQNRMGAEVEETYRRAMAQFPDKSWSHKLARWFLRQKQTAKLDQLTAEVAKTFSGTDLEQYFAQAVNRGSLAPVLYRQLNLYAHQRFPHHLAFTRNLLTAYTTRGTADPVAYEALLRANWFHADDLRARFFEFLSRTRKLDAELAALGSITTPAQVNANPAAAAMLAEGETWRAHYEVAAPVFRAIAASYPAATPEAERAAAVYRSLATLDPKQTEVAAAIEQNLVAYAPRNTGALTYAGEIWADRERFDRARPLWNRIAAIAPGRADGYLESATVFWDYFLFDDALRVIADGRSKLERPTLHAYQAGAIYENQRRYDRALAEYASAVVADSNETAQRRLVRLARRPVLRDQVERLTANLADGPDPRITALRLRLSVLKNQGRRADSEQLLLSAASRSSALDAIEWIQNQGRAGGFESVEERALQRRVQVTADPLDRVRFQLALAHFYEERGRASDAAAVIASVYGAQPNSLGVVRAATDFYWRSKQTAKAIDTLVEAAGRAQPAYRRAFRLEAARKATEAGEVPRARQLLALLVTDEPFRAEYLAAMADTYAKAGDDRGLRTFYQSTLDALRTADLGPAEKTERSSAMRRGLIPVLTRMNDFTGALNQYIEIVNRYPEDADLTREMTAYASNHKLGERLVGYYSKTAEGSPRDHRWNMVLARVNTELERFREALEAYAKATAIRPERSDLWSAQAQLQERLLRFADAERTYTRMYELSYRNPAWMERVAELRARQGQRETAIAALRAAYIENRPERSEDYFTVASRLSGWGYADAARQYAERGAEIAGADFVTDGAGAAIYARVMARARQYEAAYRRLASNGTDADKAPALPIALQMMGSTVREFFTPEEKVTFAAWIEKTRKPNSRMELEAAQAAGLQDLTVRFLTALLRATPTDYGLLGQLQDVQQRRVRFADLAAQIEAVWKATPPETENRDSLLLRAAAAFHEAGDTAGELRIIRLKKASGLDPELSQRFCSLIGQQAQALAGVLPTDSPDFRDLAANCAIQGNRPKESLAAIGLRGQGMPPVWTSAYTSLAGLYFSLNTPEVQGAFATTLGSMVIGDRIGKPVDRDRQLAGDPWFYYGSRYGEYLATLKQPGSEDFLAAMLESSPHSAVAYLRLADYYRETGAGARALERYADAIELNPDYGEAHDHMGEVLWAAGRNDQAVAAFRAALQAFIAQQEEGPVPPQFWENVRSTLVHIGDHDLLVQLKPDAHRLLRTYVRRNGTFQFDPLLEGILAAARDPARGIEWLTELSNATADPMAILGHAVRSSRVPAAQRDVLYQKLIENHQARADSSTGEPRDSAESSLRAWQLEWLRSLTERGLTDRARTLLASIPESARAVRLDQIVPLELQIAAQGNAVPDLLAKYAALKDPLPPEPLRNGASELTRHGQDAAARRVLEFLYTRELDAHRFDSANFLGLAEIRLKEGNTPAAVELLRRMTMLSGEPFDTLTAAAEMLARSGKSAEAADFYDQRVKAVPWDSVARVRLAGLRNDTAALSALVADRNASYGTRAEAATGLRNRGGASASSGSAELDLLASATPWTEALVNKPYWFPARVEAARAAKDVAVRIRILQAAVATEPAPLEPRLDLFRSAMEARRYQLAIGSVAALKGQPVLGASDGNTLPEYAVGSFFAGAPLGAVERAAVARGLGEAYQRLNDPTLSAYYNQLSLTLAPAQPGRPAIEKSIQAAKRSLELRAANDARRPVVSANLEQPNVVRPRLAAGGAQ